MHQRRKFITFLTFAYPVVAFRSLVGCGYDESDLKTKEQSQPNSNRNSDNLEAAKTPSQESRIRYPDPKPEAKKPQVEPPKPSTPVPPSPSKVEEVEFFPIYAKAMYFDGTMGPSTGTITAAHIIADKDLDLEFWHGHGGRSHRFKVTKAELRQIAKGEKVTLETDEVGNHSHKLFIDPRGSTYRVPGAAPQMVPLHEGKNS